MRSRTFLHGFSAALLTLLCAGAQPGAAEKARHSRPKPQPVRYRLYKADAENPVVADKGYALAWMAGGERIDFARFDRDETYRHHVEYDLPIVNYVVDAAQHRIVATLPVATLPDANELFFTGHSSVDFLVSPNRLWAFAVWRGKWEPENLYLVALRGKQRGRVAAFGTRYKRDLAAHLRRTIEPVTRFSQLPEIGHFGDNPDLQCEAAFVPNGLVITSHLCHSKWVAGWFFRAGLTYPLTPGGEFATAKPVVERYTEATYVTPINGQFWSGYQTNEWVFRNAPDGPPPCPRRPIPNASPRPAKPCPQAVADRFFHPRHTRRKH